MEPHYKSGSICMMSYMNCNIYLLLTAISASILVVCDSDSFFQNTKQLLLKINEQYFFFKNNEYWMIHY